MFDSRTTTVHRTRLARVLAAALAAVSLGASCDGNGRKPPSEAPGSGAPARDSSRVDGVDGVDVSSLTAGERSAWLELVNDRLAPCGSAMPVGRCAAADDACGRKCTAASRYLARLVAEGYEAGEIAALYDNRYGADHDFELDLSKAPVRGSPMAPVTVVEFSDFECPFCGRAHPVLEQLEAELRGRVKIVFMHFPLRSHTHAESAARAAVAAQKQGKFWEMHDALFENQTALEQADVERYAREIGLDMARFALDWESDETLRRVQADRAQGERVGIEATPTLFVNGRLYDAPIEGLKAYVLEELGE